MREVRFRAWQPWGGGGKPYGAMSRSFRLTDLTGGWVIDFDHENTIVDANDLVFMQYTGLKDNHSVEIYEGDIVTCMKETWRDDNVYTADVRWQENMARFAFVIRYDGDDGELFYDFADVVKVRVIGNIYENREVLKVAS